MLTQHRAALLKTVNKQGVEDEKGIEHKIGHAFGFHSFLGILPLSLDLGWNRVRIVVLLLTRPLLDGRALDLFGEIVSVRFVRIQQMLYRLQTTNLLGTVRD